MGKRAPSAAPMEGVANPVMADLPVVVGRQLPCGTWGVMMIATDPRGRLIERVLTAEQADDLADMLRAYAALARRPGCPVQSRTAADNARAGAA